MVDVFQEVEEELRKDNYLEALKKWGPWVAGGALAIIIGVGGWQYLDHVRNQQIAAAAEEFISAQTAFEEDNTALAAAAFETIAETGSGGYAALALMQRGAIALEAGDSAAAADYFDRAADETGDPIFSDLARLKAVWARWESLSFDDVELRLRDLAEADAPYRFTAAETIGAAALRDGRLDAARAEYDFLSISFEAPQGVRRRAEEALAVIRQREAIAAQAAPAIQTPVESPTSLLNHAPADTPDPASEGEGQAPQSTPDGDQ